MTPNLQQLEAAARLRSNPDFATFRQMLREYERECVDQCVTYTGDVLLRAQGKVQALREVQRTLDDVPQLIEKSKTKEKTP